MKADVYQLESTIFFFFQAEDGIRDDLVTGVQTCALPISGSDSEFHSSHWCDRSASRRKTADHGTSMDLHRVNSFHPIPLPDQFCELSSHTQDSLAGGGIRIAWPRANAHHSFLTTSNSFNLLPPLLP